MPYSNLSTSQTVTYYISNKFLCNKQTYLMAKNDTNTGKYRIRETEYIIYIGCKFFFSFSLPKLHSICYYWPGTSYSTKVSLGFIGIFAKNVCIRSELFECSENSKKLHYFRDSFHKRKPL
jgi:hypothetical protein